MNRVKDHVLHALESKRGTPVSGAALAEKLSVSRNAIWKAIRVLQEEGYEIDSCKQGYVLAEKNNILSAQSIDAYLAEEIKGRIRGEVYQELDSTNRLAKQYAMDGKEEGILVVAERQTAGRGRMGRSFYSPSETGLYLSLLLRPKLSMDLSLHLTTAAAVAACEAVEEVTGKKAQIKWVNDIFCDGKKVCGILTEASVNIENQNLDYAILGIGFNIWEPKEGFPEEIRDIAGAVLSKEDADTDGRIRSRICAEFVSRFLKYYDHLEEKTYLPSYRSRSFLLGMDVYALDQPEIHGIAREIDEDCRLVIELESGERKAFSWGEVRIRPNE